MKCLLLVLSTLSLLTQSWATKRSIYPVLQHDYEKDLTPFDQLRGSPYSIGFNNRSLTIITNNQAIKASTGQPINQEDVEYNILLQSGSIHYPRSTPEMWPHLFENARAGGLNTIQVYFFWNYNNQYRNEYDFITENRNLGQFIQLAGDAGLFVNLRIGPFVCAEWTLGGIPQWVRDLGIPFRTNNTVWENEMELITQYLVDYTKQYQASNGGPIILMQIENEYDNMEGNNPGNKEYLQWAGSLTKKVAPEVTWIMCSSHDAPDFVINTCNGFYCDSWISGHRQNFPNQPSLWTEDWSGWFYAWGEAKPRRPAQDLAFAVARWMARGGAHHNYYMYHGGTTFGRWTGGPQDTTSYDYDAPLDEYGYPNEPKYSHTTQLHNVIEQYADVIIGNPIPNPVTVGSTGEIHIYGDCANSCLQFWSNWDTANDLKMTYNGQTYVVPAWSVWLIDGTKQTVLFQTNTINPSIKETDRKAFKQAVTADPADIVYIEETVGIYDPVRALTMPRTPEMLGFTHDNTDYLWHVSNVTLTDDQVKNGSIFLTLNNVNEFVYIFFGNDRNLIAMGVNVGKSTYQIDVSKLKAGVVYPLNLLVVTMGSANCCGGLEGFTRGIQGNVLINDVAITHNPWQVLAYVQGEVQSYVNSTTASWSQGQHAFKPLTWYKVNIASPQPKASDLPSWQLDLGGMGKGQVWINGHAIGRYWLVEATQKCSDSCDWRGNYGDSKCRYDCNEPSLRLYHVPRSWLKPVGEVNEIVLFEETGGNPATISLLQRN